MSGTNSEQAFKRGLLNPNFDRRIERFVEQPIWGIPFALPLMILICFIPAIAFISTPLSITQQTLMGAVTLFLALWLNRMDGRLASLVMITLSVLVSTRYMYWRLTETLGWGMSHRDWIDTFFSVGLVAAEMYAFIVLFLGYFQVLWPLQRKPLALPKQIEEWPTVDIYIPTYNEPLSVVRPTILASMEVDWPADKLRIYVLDDGRRAEFKQFCDEVGVTHITRADSKHAKAGNLNRAMTKTQGEFIAIFDCDHIPTRSFLQVAMGWMIKDPKLAMMQTPHHFFSPDPFERNLGTFRKVPNEGELFYGLLQDGNDFWNATFFCGSCAVLRRTALDDVGGIAVETVTEDAHTALKMHRKGWKTAYLNLPQAAGLATESLSAHVGQRIRWARGMAQIFRTDNPFIAKGLSIGQRFCYANAMLHFFYGLPRLVFLTAPLSYLFFEAHIIEASALAIAAYAAPHLVHANITNSRLQGAFRHSFWAEVYETVLATYILLPTTMALINPKLGTFNVTVKGGMVDKGYFDRSIARPYLILLALNVVGFCFGAVRFVYFNTHELDTVLLNMFWTVYNSVILGAAVAVAWESQQIRRTIRVAVALPAKLRLPDGQIVDCTTRDISEGGTALTVGGMSHFTSGTEIEVALLPQYKLVWTKAKIVRSVEGMMSLNFLPLNLEQERQLVFTIFGRADAWMEWSTNRRQDRLGQSFGEVARYGVSGVARIVHLGITNFVATMKKNKAAIMRIVSTRRGVGTALGVLLVLGLFGIQGAAIAQEGEGRATRAESRTLSFEDMGINRPVRLRGSQGEIAIPLSVRDDEIVRRARLTLKYSHSPSLIFPLSHLNVFMNNELAATIPSSAETAEGAERVIDLDPLLFVRFNQIGLQFIGNYTLDCQNPLNSVLWSIISNQSTLELDIEPIALPDDLTLLPQPFFDSRDQRRLVLPIVFARAPSLDELRAAGVVASWFGSLAAYRGAEFPVHIGELPPGHAIVISGGGAMPQGLSAPSANGASVSMVANPRSPDSKLLVVAGTDGQALNIAAKALSLKTGSLSGALAQIREFNDPAPREPYDAPRWLPTDRAVELGEVYEFPLVASGAYPDLIRVPFSLPPDLFTWRNKGLKLDLKYRYTPSVGSKSTLNVNVNNEFVEAVALSVTNDERYAEDRINLPFVSQYDAVNASTIYVPDYKFGVDNELQFQYYFERDQGGPCRDVVLDNLRGGIDKDSTIDLRGMPHYTQMPDLSKFASSGWPFTRMADLSETVVILPDSIQGGDIELFLALMGRIGRATGFPAHRVRLAVAGDVSQFDDADLLVLGTGASQPLLSRWADDMPMTFTAGDMRINLIGPVERMRARWENRDVSGAQRHAGNMVLDASDDLGAIMGFQSPMDSDRSVVVIAASTSAGLGQMADVLSDPGKSQFVRNELVLVSGDVVNHYDLGARYSMGRLPMMLGLRWWLSHQPMMLVVIGLLASLLVALVLYRVLRRMAIARKDANT
jgi:cellulose synthase (UDP-forming)